MSSLMHTIYEVVDASVNHSSGSSKTLRVKLTVSPEPSSKRKECPTGQGEGLCQEPSCSEGTVSMSIALETGLYRVGRSYSHLIYASHLLFPIALTSPLLTPGYWHCSCLLTAFSQKICSHNVPSRTWYLAVDKTVCSVSGWMSKKSHSLTQRAEWCRPPTQARGVQQG